jgi:hypothetical protein
MNNTPVLDPIVAPETALAVDYESDFIKSAHALKSTHEGTIPSGAVGLIIAIKILTVSGVLFFSLWAAYSALLAK